MWLLLPLTGRVGLFQWLSNKTSTVRAAPESSRRLAGIQFAVRSNNLCLRH